jgi:DNA-binding NarL/FixJ family response regulator
MVVRSFLEEPADCSETEQLSPREMEILALVAQGRANKEVAGKLHISPGTVRIHLSHIYEKLHVRCRTEAAVKFFSAQPSARRGIVPATS